MWVGIYEQRIFHNNHYNTVSTSATSVTHRCRQYYWYHTQACAAMQVVTQLAANVTQ